MANPPSSRLSANHGNAPAPALKHATPLHTPQHSQHSLHSSTSSRTPLHTLTLHEYRKLQNTPTAPSAAPPGKTLRRKAAASALNELERAPSVKRTPDADSRPFARPFPGPLRLSQSAHQLATQQRLPPSPPHSAEQAALVDGVFRSASAATAVGYSAEDPRQSIKKVSNWKSAKRLPKPYSATPSPYIPLASAAISCPPFQTTPTSSTGDALPSGIQTTSSTFSPSRFPRPPHLIGLSPPNDENAPSQLNNSFTVTAPETPPATPAVIHYRGASFDLVNPHDSLLFHDIETPSRDLDSTEYLPLRSSEEPLVHPEMAPRRALYGDLTSAYSSIRRRDETSDPPDTNDPLPPVPAYLSPQSSSYSSPDNSYATSFAVSPLTVMKKPPAESRFSLRELTPIKQLTRTFTKKLGRTPEPKEQELQDLSTSPMSPAIIQPEGQYPRPLDDSYFTRLSPAEKYDGQRTSYFSGDGSLVSGQRFSSAPLSSMIPDDPSLQMGYGQATRISASVTGMASKPYYEEVASLYPSSSIYAGEEGGNPPSLYSKRASKAYNPLNFEDDSFDAPHNPENIYSFSNTNQTSMYSFSNADPKSNAYSRGNREYPRQSQLLHDEKTDTITKFIDQYDRREGRNTSKNIPSEVRRRPRAVRRSSSLSQFDFDVRHSSSGSPSQSSLVPPIQASRARKPTVTEGPGAPPHCSAPSAPAFEYDEDPNLFKQPNASDAFSGASSYGDTRHLLRLTPAGSSGLTNLPAVTLEPSSSYSQPENRVPSGTPQEALDQAAQIFEQAGTRSNIPAMWTRRVSGNLLYNRHSTGTEGAEDQGDWETVGHDTQHSVASDSFADFSDTSADLRASWGTHHGVPTPETAAPGLYCHPSPLPTHEHPFSSSPPALSVRTSAHTPLQESRTIYGASSPLYAATTPFFHSTTHGYRTEPYLDLQTPDPACESSPYELSDKVMQEMLNSGPNDDILYEDDKPGYRRSRLSLERKAIDVDQHSPYHDNRKQPTLSLFHDSYNSVVMKHQNSFEKLSTLGPKGNVTGTPQGTGMNEVGSSVADNSSPGAEWSLSATKKQYPTGFTGFHNADEYSSKSIIGLSRQAAPVLTIEPYGRTASHDTLYALPDDPLSLSGRPQSVRSAETSSSSRRSHGHARSAVPGQTKLRQMMLAPGMQSRSSIHSHSTHFSYFVRGGGGSSLRASSDAPLRRPATQDGRAALTPSLAHTRSPHLRNPERALDLETESERKRLSWIIFGIFCILPPLMILFRWFGDSFVVWTSNGRLGSASSTPKRVALYAGVPLNILIVIAIVVPIIVIHA